MTTASVRASASTRTTLGRRLTAGAVGGLAGGLVFGMVMAVMGMLVTLAGMVHSASPIVGLGIHLMISIVFGLVFALVGVPWLSSWSRALVAGAIYGVIVWVFGPLIMMPIMLGGALFAFGPVTVLNLMGHLVYAMILAAVAFLIVRRRA